MYEVTFTKALSNVVMRQTLDNAFGPEFIALIYRSQIRRIVPPSKCKFLATHSL